MSAGPRLKYQGRSRKKYTKPRYIKSGNKKHAFNKLKATYFYMEQILLIESK